MGKEQDELIFVGFTNGNQILHASSTEYGGEGSFYSDTEGDCYIPLYMLKVHAHRIETTSIGDITLDKIVEAQKAK